VDINECATSNGGCDLLTTCTNTGGSRACGVCPSGYTGTGATGCVAITDCGTANGGCDPLTTCTNTGGVNTCGACPAGYSGTGATRCVRNRVDCYQFLELGESTGDGLYTIDPDGSGSSLPAQVYCDMTGGGWTQILDQDTDALRWMRDSWESSRTEEDNIEVRRVAAEAIAFLVSSRRSDPEV